MLQLIYFELYKIIKRPRSFIGFAAITVIVVIVQVALYLGGSDYVQFITQPLQQSFDIQGTIVNGNFVAYVILQTLIVQMPLLVTLVTGDLISGEAASGTIRLLATKPVSRIQILFSKFIAAGFYTLALIAWLAVLIIGLGLLIFGKGDLIVLNSDHLTILGSNDMWWRFLGAFVIAFISLGVVATFSLMLSCFTDNSIGPIIVTMSVIIIFTVIDTLDIPLFDSIKPFLFTTHMIVWRDMFDDPVDVSQITTSLMILTGHIFLFLGIAVFYFRKKNILS